MALPKVQVYTTDKTSPRSFPWLWFLRLPAIVVTIIVLGITAANHTTFTNSSCSAPSKLNYNLAVSVISFVFLIYLILSTGPSPKVRLLPWAIYGQLLLDALLFIFWLAAAASSRYNCNDLCNACSDFSTVYYDNLFCYCFNGDDGFFKRDQSPVPRSDLEKRRVVQHNSDSASGYAATADARKAFDAIMVLIFFACLISDLLWIVTASRHNSTTTTTTAPGQAPMGTAPIKQEEAGMGGIPMNNQHQGANTHYYNNAQPMPQQQQGGGYQQPTMPPQGQYPPQYSQGHPQPPYPQGQGMPPQQQNTYVTPKEGASEVYSPSHTPAPQ
ncbi:hypothetical protein ACLMJK_006235 [Lecanora helva]